MNKDIVKALVNMLTYYFDSVSEIDRAMVAEILEGIRRLLK